MVAPGPAAAGTATGTGPVLRPVATAAACLAAEHSPRLKQEYTNDTAEPLLLAGTCCADIAVTQGIAAAEARPISARAAISNHTAHCSEVAAVGAAAAPACPMQGRPVTVVATDHTSNPRINTAVPESLSARRPEGSWPSRYARRLLACTMPAWDGLRLK